MADHHAQRPRKVIPRRTGSALTAVVTCAVLGACSSTSGSTPSRTSGAGPSSPAGSSASAVGGSPGASRSTSPQVEVNPPGDIPDNQAFVAYSGSGYSVSVPEGWARSSGSGPVTFSDKYNSITVSTRSVATAPTTASAQRDEVPLLSTSVTGYRPGTVSSVRRTAGPAVLITYRSLSAVNPVTGKVAKLAVERYEFWRSGSEIVLTLAAPVGSDNVDPWRKVTDSFTWK